MWLFQLAMARTVCVPSTFDPSGPDCDLNSDRYDTLDEALTELVLEAGPHRIRLPETLVINQPVVIEGGQAFSSIRLEGEGAGPMFITDGGSDAALRVQNNASVSVDTARFSIPVDAGAIMVEDGGLGLTNVVITRSDPAPTSVSAIRVISGSLSIADSTFTDWVTSGAEGAFIDSAGSTDITRTSFSGGAADEGGAVRLRGYGLIDASTFTGNQATIRGGAVLIDTTARVFIDGSTFTGNGATGTAGGGAIHVVAAERVEVATTSFIDNIASGGPGGAVLLQSPAQGAVIAENTFRSNTAQGTGGAVSAFDATDGQVVLAENLFEGNAATGDGGAVYTRASSIRSSTNVFQDNVAQNGAGIHVAGGILDSTADRFCGQQASAGGGAMRIGTGAEGNVVRAIFLANSAVDAGGALRGSSVQVDHTSFIDNSAAVGAAFAAGGNSFMHNSLVVGHETLAVNGSSNAFDFNAWWENTPAPGIAQPGDNDVLADPLLSPRAPDSCDFEQARPAAGSPAQDAGDDGLTIGALEPAGGIDADADGYPVGEDCDDADPQVNPGATETCDPGDEDCDGLEGDDDPDTVGLLWYLDFDGDGSPGFGVRACEAPPDATPAPDGTPPEDCDDTDASIHPGAIEVCNGLDDDCDGRIDDFDDDVVATTWFVDADGDGLPGTETVQCVPPEGASDTPTDCDDTDRFLTVEIDSYADVDGDGHGDPNTPVLSCEAYSLPGDDCDDTDASVHPGATEVEDDGVDQDCDGEDLPMRWGNGVGSCSTAPVPGWIGLIALLALRRR